MSKPMSKQEFEQKHNVKLVDKKDSLVMKITAIAIKPFCPDFMEGFFTTYRLPFQKSVIAYPHVLDPMEYADVLEHELMHVEQQRTTWGLIKSAFLVSVFPLPVLFSGRWFIEREPYLNDIRKGLKTIDEAVDLLWGSYGWAWPKFLMRKWFERKLKEND